MDQPICELQNCHLETGKKGEKISLYNIEQINKVIHSTGTIGDVFVARVMKYNENNVAMPNLGDFIGFELNQETTKYLLKHPELQKDLMGWLAYYYTQEKGDGNPYCMDKFFLGQMVRGDDGQYISSGKSEFVEQCFDKYVEQKIQVNRELRRVKEQNDRAQKEKEEFYEKLRVEQKTADNEVFRRQEAQRRAQNPYLKRTNKYVMQDGTEYKAFEEYDGVDILEGRNKGNIIRLRKLEKVGKDGSGTYLYSGYISNTPNEYDVELTNGKMQAICFEIYARLEDIVKAIEENDKKPQIEKDKSIEFEKNALLEFFSNPQNFKNPDKLNYIGHLKRNFEILGNGEIKREYVLAKEIDNSTAIGIKIRNMQKEFDAKNQAEER